MPPLPKTLLSTLLRTPLHLHQPPHPIQTLTRRAYSAQFQNLPSKILSAAKGDWGAQVRKIGNGLVLYVPIVACLMFWPYAAAPVMLGLQTGL